MNSQILQGQNPDLIALVLAGLAAAGILLSGGAAFAQSTISNVSPNGANQFQYSAVLSFTAASSAGIAAGNITVVLTETTLTGQTTLKILSGVSGLGLTGSSTSWNVTAPSTATCFARPPSKWLTPTPTPPAPRYHLTPSTPPTRSRRRILTTTADIPFPIPRSTLMPRSPASREWIVITPGNGGQSAYRPNPLETEGVNDTPRLSHAAQDYDVGYNNANDWGNYTHSYPTGTYNIYLRGSDGNGQVSDSASMSVVTGTGVLNGSGKPQFSVPNIGGWNSYHWVPLLDANNNLVQFVSDGSVNTLRVTTDNGNYNANFYMLLPTNTSPIAAGSASVANPYPDGAHQFEPSPTLSFNAVTPIGINASGIVVLLGATNMFGQGASSLLSSGSGLTVTGIVHESKCEPAPGQQHSLQRPDSLDRCEWQFHDHQPGF